MPNFRQPDKSVSRAFVQNGIYVGNVTRVDEVSQQIYVEIPRYVTGFEFGPLNVSSTDLPLVGDTVACLFLENKQDDIMVIGIVKDLDSAVSVTPVVATSTTRPDSPRIGTIIYETDTQDSFVWTGSSWVVFSVGDNVVPPGGTINQLLKKNSSTDFDTSWTSALTVTSVATSTLTADSVTMNSGGTRKVTTAGTELILEQTGDAYGRSSLNLRNRNGAGGAIFYTRNAAGGAMGVVDFGFDSGLLYQSNIRMEARPDEYGTIKVGPATGTPFNRTNVTEVQFVDNPTAVGGVAASFYFCSNKLATVVRVGKFGVGADDPTGQIHIKASSASTIGSIVQGAVSQTANLSEWQNSAGSIVAKVTSSGELQATVIDGGSA